MQVNRDGGSLRPGSHARTFHMPNRWARRGSGVMGFQNKTDPKKGIPSELVFF